MAKLYYLLQHKKQSYTEMLYNNMVSFLELICSLIFISIVQYALSENYNLNNLAEKQNSQLKYFFSTTNSEWRVFKRMARVSLEKCKDGCKDRPQCKAIAYQRLPLVCNLLSTKSDAATKKQRGIVLIMGFNKENNGSLETEKKKTECEIAKSVFKIDGNIYDVGSSVRFDGKDNGIGLFHVCEENGEWKSIRKGLLYDFNFNVISMAGDCSDVTGPSGIYWAPLTNRPIFCDMDTEDGQWMLFQRREDGNVDFYRNWANYTSGFGSIGGEFWMGLQPLYEVCSAHDYQLRIDMVAFNGSKGYATYAYFSIGSSDWNYRLHVYGYNGNVGGDSFGWHNGMQFSTFDRDNDVLRGDNCAVMYKGAWWYKNCHESNLNGLFSFCGSSCEFGVNIEWFTWIGDNTTLIRTEMKVKRN